MINQPHRYVFLLNNCPISWTSHKQSSVVISTTEAEYMALSDAEQEAISKNQLFQELWINLPPPALLSDSQSTFVITQEPTQHQREKHTRIRYHSIRYAYPQEEIFVPGYVPTKEQTADVLIRALHPAAIMSCISLMRIKST